MTIGIPPEILRLTAYPFPARLDDAMGSGERRSPICGSRVIVDVVLAEDGRIGSYGMRVNACAFGQAAAAVLAQGLKGRSVDDVAAVRDALAAWITGAGPMPDWPDMAFLDPARLNAVRKASVQLAFQAAAEAAATAADAQSGSSSLAAE